MKTLIVLLLTSWAAMAENGIKCPHCGGNIPAKQIVALLKQSNPPPAVAANPRVAALEKKISDVLLKKSNAQTRENRLTEVYRAKVGAGQSAAAEVSQREAIWREIAEYDKQIAATRVEILKIDPDYESKH